MLGVESAFDMQHALDAERLVVAVIFEIDAEPGQRPALVLGIHAQRDRGAGAEPRQHIAEGRHAGIAAAGADADLVGDEFVMPGANLGAVTRRGQLGTGACPTSRVPLCRSLMPRFLQVRFDRSIAVGAQQGWHKPFGPHQVRHADSDEEFAVLAQHGLDLPRPVAVACI